MNALPVLGCGRGGAAPATNRPLPCDTLNIVFAKQVYGGTFARSRRQRFLDCRLGGTTYYNFLLPFVRTGTYVANIWVRYAYRSLKDAGRLLASGTLAGHLAGQILHLRNLPEFDEPRPLAARAGDMPPLERRRRAATRRTRYIAAPFVCGLRWRRR